MMDLTDHRLKLAIFYELKSIGVNVARTKSEERAHKRNSREALKDAPLVFGARLIEVVERQGVDVDGLIIPRFLQDVFVSLRANVKTTGLFRIPGNAQRIKQIQADLNAGKPLSGTPSDHASVLKAFFRELEDPLFTFGFFHGFVAAFKLQDEELRKKAVLMLCCLLEEEHLHTLSALMRLLKDVAEEPENQMTVASIASILTPNLLRPREEAAVTTQLELSTHASCVGVVELLITSADEIGAVPLDVVRAAQEMRDEEKAKKAYLRLLSGRKLGWWSRSSILPKRSILKSSGAVSVQTLNLLKKSERAAERMSPMVGRNRGAVPPASRVEYSQVLARSTASSQSHSHAQAAS